MRAAATWARGGGGEGPEGNAGAANGKAKKNQRKMKSQLATLW